MDEINVTGLISLAVFYLIILAIGVWAGWRQKRKANREGRDLSEQEDILLAGRDIGLLLGIVTLGATWVGGGFINGSAEAAYTDGLLYVQAPVGYGLSLVISGTFFAKKMRDSEYVTMIDPFTNKFGKWGALQALVAAMSEIFWSAAILAALGSTLQVVLGIERIPSIIVSAVIAVLYTLVGGLISVAYTDVFQMVFVALGLFLSLPFALNNEHVKSIDFSVTDWMGELPSYKLGTWIDYWCLCLLGGIPWQAYFQRVLSSKSSGRAILMSYGGCLIALAMAVPSTLFGGIAKATDWQATDFGRAPNKEEVSLVLPLCLQYLTPQWVAFFGLGAVSAAVMSSTDSSMLSSSSMMARNVYKVVFRPNARDREVVFVLWVFIVLNAALAATLAILYVSVYKLFVLCGDLVYVIVFPQLCLVLYFSKANTYGSISGFFFGLIFRLLCGEENLGIPATIEVTVPCAAYAGNDCQPGSLPFRTIIMVISFLVHVVVSLATDAAFTKQYWSLKYDLLGVYGRNTYGKVVAISSRNLEGQDIHLVALPPQGEKISIPRPSRAANSGNINYGFQGKT